MEKWKSKFENYNRITNLEQSFWTAVVCMALICAMLFCCSIFGNQNRDLATEAEFDIMYAEIETEIPNENIKIETELIEAVEDDEVEESATIVEPEPVEEPKFNATTPYFPLSDEDRQIALSIMACECPYEPWEGQLMVAQCIMDFMSYYGYDMQTVKLYFDGWNPNLENSNPDAWATLNAAIDEVFVYGNLPTEETVLWFYNPKICSSSWHESQKFVAEICCHRFFAPWEG